MNRVALVAVVGAGVLGAVLGLSACGSDVHSGTVTGKQYDEAYTQMVPIMTGKTMMIIPEYQPECWEIDLKDAKGHTGSVCVSSETYNKTQIGAQYGQ